MDISGIIAVSGMPGLFKVIAQTRGGLVVESLADGKRLPIHASSKVSALEDISIYGVQEDMPLRQVLEGIHNAGNELPDPKAQPEVVRSAFAACVPQYDDARVYTSDMKKVFTWYALLKNRGLMDAEAPAEAPKTELTEAAAKPSKAAAKPKESPKTSTPKASSKGMAKTQTVRKTGA